MEINVDKYGIINISGMFSIGYQGGENVGRMGKYRFTNEEIKKLEEAVEKAKKIRKS